MFQILRNTFFTQYKQKRRGPETLDPEVLDGLPHTSGTVGVDNRMAGPLDGTAGLDLTAALNRLPEEYRSVVLLADLEDFSMGEIAAILECPVGTVKSRLFRARGGGRRGQTSRRGSSRLALEQLCDGIAGLQT